VPSESSPNTSRKCVHRYKHRKYRYAGRPPSRSSPGKYHVALEDKPFLLLRFPFTLDHAGVRFMHPNLLARFTDIQEYKHYRKDGSKFWSARPGVDLLIAVEKRLISCQEDGALTQNCG